jgi:hypothetical protein
VPGEPAAFVDGIGVPFVVIKDLAAVLSEVADPVADMFRSAPNEVVVFTPITEQSR